MEGKAIMVPNSAPGDRVITRLIESKERYAIGEIVKIVTPSPLRQTPPCTYVGDCGGCTWQHIGYPEQLKAKQQSVADALRRIGKLDGFDLRPIIASPQHRTLSPANSLAGQRGETLGLLQRRLAPHRRNRECFIAAHPLNRGDRALPPGSTNSLPPRAYRNRLWR